MWQSLKNLFTNAPTSEVAARRRKLSRGLRLESLENRELFALATGETLVNSTTALNQYDVATASAPDGRSVSVWTHHHSSSDTDIYAQRFAANGTKVGGEIRVATSSRPELLPDVAMDSTGDFVVTWVDEVTSSNSDIKAQRFSSSGATRGGVITVANSSKNETAPSIAAAANGDFVVAWTLEFSSLDDDIKARMFADSGAAIGSTFTVANSSSTNETYPDVARAPDGRFAVSYSIGSNNGDFMVKRYSATGSLVNTHTVGGGTNQQVNGRISMDNNANVMATWEEKVGADMDIKARRISNTGIMGSVITVVNTTDFEQLPEVAYKRDGTGFVVTYRNTSKGGLFAAEFTNNGATKKTSLVSSKANFETAPIVFGAGNNFRIGFSRISTSTGSDVYQRLGTLS